MIKRWTRTAAPAAATSRASTSPSPAGSRNSGTSASAANSRSRAPTSSRSRSSGWSAAGAARPTTRSSAGSRRAVRRDLRAEELDDDAAGTRPVVEVDAHDLLPDPEQQLPAVERDGHRRPDQCGARVAVAVRVGVALVVLPAEVLGRDSL